MAQKVKEYILGRCLNLFFMKIWLILSKTCLVMKTGLRYTLAEIDGSKKEVSAKISLFAKTQI